MGGNALCRRSAWPAELVGVHGHLAVHQEGEQGVAEGGEVTCLLI